MVQDKSQTRIRARREGSNSTRVRKWPRRGVALGSDLGLGFLVKECEIRRIRLHATKLVSLHETPSSKTNLVSWDVETLS